MDHFQNRENLLGPLHDEAFLPGQIEARERANREIDQRVIRVDLRPEPRRPDAPEVHVVRPPVFGDAQSLRRFQDAAEAARETQRLAGIRCAVRHGWSVTVGKRTWHAGDAIDQGEVGPGWGDVQREALSVIERGQLATRCSHGPTHVTVGSVGSYTLGSRVCAKCFDRAGVEAVAAVNGYVTWDGIVMRGTPPVHGVRAVDGRTVVADLTAKGRLRALARGE